MKRLIALLITTLIFSSCEDLKKMQQARNLRMRLLDTLETGIGKPIDSTLLAKKHDFSRQLKSHSLRHSVYYNDSTNLGYFIENEGQILRYVNFDSISVIEESKRIVDERANKIKSQFSGWDGSHIKLEQAIKNSLNDPNSYEHIETDYTILDNKIHILTTFRANNAFGGKVVNQAKAVFTLEGEQISAEFLN